MTPTITEYSKREQRGWYFYDWANSVFATSGIALFIPRYVAILAMGAQDSSGYVYPLGIPVAAGSYWYYLVSFSVLCQVLVLPLIGAVADYGRRKKECLGITAFIGAASAIAMFFLGDNNYLIAGGLFVIGNLAMGASVVVYNSFLPEIAPPEERDSVSSRGWALGYVAGSLALVFHFLLLARAGSLGIDNNLAIRICLCSTGVWWALFTIPVLLRLRNRGPARSLPPGKSLVGTAFGQFVHTLQHMRGFPNTLKFLIAYLLYNDAIQTVFASSAQFGNYLGFGDDQLAITILIAQVVGIFGAMGFNRLAGALNARTAVMIALFVWTGVLIYAYGFVHTITEFYVMGAIAGAVMGGSQALSRSIFAQLVPAGKEAEYFSLYEIGDKGTSWLGPLTFGLAFQITGSPRIALLSLIVFFALGIAVLARADVKQGALDVARHEG
jgi:UMF1 family MFS transporter